MAFTSLRRLQIQLCRCYSPVSFIHFRRSSSTSDSNVFDRVANLFPVAGPRQVPDKYERYRMRQNYTLAQTQDCYSSFKGNRGFSSTASSQLPVITDLKTMAAFKDLMAVTWDDIPHSVLNETKKALSKKNEDEAGHEALANVFRAAEASVEFGSTLVSLRMALDELCGLTGENVGRLPDGLEDAIKAAYGRYNAYLESFGPEEGYLKKKVESELGTKMIHIKMRCSGIGSEWGKVTLIGTSGISGTYIELRA